MEIEVKVVRTRRGARVTQDDAVLSEVLSRPGPEHGVFDVLAAAIAAAPGVRCLLLGFAAGGVVAPLRAMGHRHPIDAVDLSRFGEEVFREVTGEWVGEVRVEQAEAGEWLRRRRRRYDVIVDDLSVPSAEGVVKPDESFEVLPGRIHRRLSRDGVAVFNLLPRSDLPWREMVRRVRRPFRKALAVAIGEYQNRLLLAGDRLRPAAEVSARLRRLLSDVGSRQAGRVTVRTVGDRG